MKRIYMYNSLRTQLDIYVEDFATSEVRHS